jgi:hypothetical protein
MAQFNNRFEGDNYGTINQVGGDQVVIHGASSAEALEAAVELRRLLRGLDLSSAERQLAEGEIDSIQKELRKDSPNKETIASHLDGFTRTLKSVGAFAAAGAALFGPIGIVAGFLGPAGDAMVRALRER